MFINKCKFIMQGLDWSTVTGGMADIPHARPRIKSQSSRTFSTHSAKRSLIDLLDFAMNLKLGTRVISGSSLPTVLCWILAALPLSYALDSSLGVSSPTVKTTSGILRGLEEDGVISFRGIPFAQPPIGDLRWEPPVPFLSDPGSDAIHDATALSPACIQQFAPATRALFERVFNTPAPPAGESEDCLFLNVWAQAGRTGEQKAVVFFSMPHALFIPKQDSHLILTKTHIVHGGALEAGTASTPAFDGTSFAKNQDVVVVTTNYRTNAFGFPSAEELFPFQENLGFLDQDLALQWVQDNIDAFGGDPKKVTIMGQSAGSESVAQAIQRHAQNTPFRGGIMESGAATSMSPIPKFTSFDGMAKAMNCTQSPGAPRLACLRAVSTDAISTWVNGPQGLSFGAIVDNVTVFANPIQRIRQKKTARIPILSGANQDDGTVFTVGETSLTGFLDALTGGLVTVDEVRAAYPGLNDTQIIPAVFRDKAFLCPGDLTVTAFVQSGEVNVFRYIYGAVFADLQLFPGAGAWHSSELGEIFGNYNKTTATPAEKTLSRTMQTMWAKFIKDPTVPPVPNWKRFTPGNNTDTLAMLAYKGNVQLGNVVDPSPGGLDDSPCDTIWNAMLA
ncbi:alpha/beta-hydrolase [Ramaria rubella]|nr:alpha/beta-hydrolase [Ramaria rubella]